METLDAALAAAGEVGYPLMLKATAGGGGRGIRMVASPADLEDAYQRTSDEALRAFGNGTVFLERLVTGARHVEVQLIADSHGTAWAVGVRDCSIQRRNQKVIEESSSPLLTSEQAEEVKASAERLALAVGYVGAGTVEFLYHPGEKTSRSSRSTLASRWSTRSPRSRPTSTWSSRRSTLRKGAAWRGRSPQRRGTPSRPGSTPRTPIATSPRPRGASSTSTCPRAQASASTPESPRATTFPPDFDSMIAKIIAYGRTREEALARLRRAMSSTTVVIEGGACNKSFVLDLLAQPEVVNGEGGWADTGWIDRVRAEGRLAPHAHAGIAVVTAAIEAYRDRLQIETARLLETAHGGRPSASTRWAGRSSSGSAACPTRSPRSTRTRSIPGERRLRRHRAERRRRDGADRRRRPAPGRRRPDVPPRHRHPWADHLVEVDGVAHRVSRDEGGVLRSPAPALVVATPVAVGTEVEAGAAVIVLESMKMETVVHAPFPARVKELLVITGSQVETGTALIKLEPLGEGEDEAPRTRSRPRPADG